MKYINLFESFHPSKSIDLICKRFNLRDYTINPDGTVDFSGNVYIADNNLSKLPLKFGKVGGDFSCSSNQLRSLDGCPKEVGGDFYCRYNKLASLEGSPKEVNGIFDCRDNQLTSLEGGPTEVGGDFYCSGNKQLKSLKGSPREVGGYFNCFGSPIYIVYNLFSNYKKYQDSLDYNYLRGTDIIKSRFREALQEIGKEVPVTIKGYNYI